MSLVWARDRYYDLQTHRSLVGVSYANVKDMYSKIVVTDMVCPALSANFVVNYGMRLHVYRYGGVLQACMWHIYTRMYPLGLGLIYGVLPTVGYRKWLESEVAFMDIVFDEVDIN